MVSSRWWAVIFFFFFFFGTGTRSKTDLKCGLEEEEEGQGGEDFAGRQAAEDAADGGADRRRAAELPLRHQEALEALLDGEAGVRRPTSSSRVVTWAAADTVH